jgi:hypothetical protein
VIILSVVQSNINIPVLGVLSHGVAMQSNGEATLEPTVSHPSTDSKDRNDTDE